jgi:hypothetical protein
VDPVYPSGAGVPTVESGASETVTIPLTLIENGIFPERNPNVNRILATMKALGHQ